MKRSIRLGAVALHVATLGALCLLGQGQTHAQSAGRTQLSLRKACELGLRGNADLELRRVAVLQANVGVRRELGAFAPKLGGALSIRRETRATAFPFQDPAALFGLTTMRYGGYLSGTLPTSTAYEVRLQSIVQWTELNASAITPQHVNTASLTLNQPLLRANWSVGKSRLEVARANASASSQDVRSEIESMLMKIVRAYWELVARAAELDIAQQAVQLSKTQVKATRLRVRGGNLSRLDLTEAKAAVAAREQEQVAARLAQIAAEKTLLLLIYSRRADRDGSLPLANRLNATDQPRLQVEQRSLDGLVTSALAKRSEIIAVDRRMRARRLGLGQAHNTALPKLDLQLIAGLSSLAGTSTFRQPGHNLVPGDPTPLVLGNHLTAWRQVFSFRQPYVQVGLTFEMPLSRDARRADLLQERAAMRQLRVQRRGLVNRVAVEVRDGWLKIKQSTERVAAARKGLALARKNLSAARKKFKGGISTSFDVLRVQLDLSTARRNVVRALKDHAIARSELARALGGLASSVGVSIKAD